MNLYLVLNLATGRTAEIFVSARYGGYPSEWLARYGQYNEDGSVREHDWKINEFHWREP